MKIGDTVTRDDGKVFTVTFVNENTQERIKKGVFFTWNANIECGTETDKIVYNGTLNGKDLFVGYTKRKYEK